MDTDTVVIQKPVQDYIEKQQPGLTRHPFSIIIASVPDRDHLVAEITYQDNIIAEISREKEDEDFVIHLYPQANQAFPYKSFWAVLATARKQLATL